MSYPKKPPSLASKEEKSNKTISKKQREELKRLLAEKYQDLYKVEDQSVLNAKIDRALGGGSKLTGAQLQELENSIKNGATAKNTLAQRVTIANKNVDDDALSVRSGISKMSGATNLGEIDFTNTKKSQPLVIDYGTVKPQTSQYKFEAQEWADIYKHNNEYYKEEEMLEKKRVAESKKRFREELDFLVMQKEKAKEKDVIQKQIDHEQIIKRLEIENAKEKKKADEMKEKIMYEKKMRDLQLKQNKIQRRQEQKENKTLDKIILHQINEQITKEKEIERKRKEQELTMMRKVINEIEDNKVRREQQKQMDRQEEVNMQNKYNEMVDAQERQRQEEFQAKEERIRQIMEAGKAALVQLYDEKLKKQEDKIKHWEDKNERRLQAADQEEKRQAWLRKLDTRAYLEEQMEEKKLRQQDEKEKYYKQAEYWKNENQKFEQFQKSKAEFNKERQKQYAAELKQQIEEKLEEKRVGNLLLTLREQQWNKKPGQY